MIYSANGCSDTPYPRGDNRSPRRFRGHCDDQGGSITLGDGPVIMRGSTNHRRLVEYALSASDEADIPIQIQAAGEPFGTDALAFFTQHGGIPTLDIALPLRYLHTPTETIDSTDLNQLTDLLEAFVLDASDHDVYTHLSR